MHSAYCVRELYHMMCLDYSRYVYCYCTRTQHGQNGTLRYCLVIMMMMMMKMFPRVPYLQPSRCHLNASVLNASVLNQAHL